MEKFYVETSFKNYPFYLGLEISKNISSILIKNNLDVSDKSILIITDDKVASLYLDEILQSLRANTNKVSVKVIPYGETSKSLLYYQEIIETCIENKLERDSLLIALGGGVIGDITGFVASTYMRGIKLILIPTTILAHDSSIGGKNAINVGEVKNICGTIYQPDLILFDTKFMESLPKRQYLSGMAEVILHGVIKDPNFLEWLEINKSSLINKEQKTMQEAIIKSAKIKADIISKDTLEHGERYLLNFGHTFGHALESVTNFRQYTHGEAVGIGMLLAILYSYYEGFCSFDLFIRIRNLLKEFKIPLRIDNNINGNDILKSMYTDKKVNKRQLRLILIKNIGEVFIMQDIKEKQVLRAINYLQQ